MFLPPNADIYNSLISGQTLTVSDPAKGVIANDGDAGGPADGSSACGNGFPACGNSTLLANLARTVEDFSVPTNLRVPGAVYCSNADCTGFSIAAPPAGGGPGGSTGRIDPPWATSYGWQSFMGQNQYLEFGKKPYNAGENGDPALLLQLTWEPPGSACQNQPELPGSGYDGMHNWNQLQPAPDRGEYASLQCKDD